MPVKRPKGVNKKYLLIGILGIATLLGFGIWYLNNQKDISSKDSEAGIVSTTNSYRSDRCGFIYKTQSLENLKKNVLFSDNSSTFYTQSDPKGKISYSRASLTVGTNNSSQFLTRMPHTTYRYPNVAFAFNNLVLSTADSTVVVPNVKYSFFSTLKKRWIYTYFESRWDNATSTVKNLVRINYYDEVTKKEVLIKRLPVTKSSLDHFTFSIDGTNAYVSFKEAGITSSVSYTVPGYGGKVEDTYVTLMLPAGKTVSNNTKAISFNGFTVANCY